MTTKITEPIRRELLIAGTPYTVVINQDGIKVTRKGYRIGAEMTWRQILVWDKLQTTETDNKGRDS